MEQVTVTGMVISAMPISEYDKRVVLLTKKLGKITAFARGARKSGSAYAAGTQPLVMAEFTLYQGRDAYTVNAIKIIRYFGDELKEFEKISLASYFMELAEYYGRENEDAADTLNLLYVSFKALINEQIPDRLVRRIFELKMLVINGEYPQVYECAGCGSKEKLNTFDIKRQGVLCDGCAVMSKGSCPVGNTALYALQYIISAPVDRLYTFYVSDEALGQLENVIGECVSNRTDRNFKSLQFI